MVEELSIADLVSKSEIDLRHVDILRYMDDDATIDLLTSLNQGLIERDRPNTLNDNLSHLLADMPRVGQFFGEGRRVGSNRDSPRTVIICDCPRNC